MLIYDQLGPANNQQFSNMQFRPANDHFDKFDPANNPFSASLDHLITFFD